LCVSLSEIGLWMNIFWIYRSRYTSCVGTSAAADRRPAVQGRLNLGTIFLTKNHSIDGGVQNVQCVQLVPGTFKSSKGSMRSRVQLIKRTINTFNWFKEVQSRYNFSYEKSLDWWRCSKNVQSRYNFSNEKSLDCLRSVSIFHRMNDLKNHSIDGGVQRSSISVQFF